MPARKPLGTMLCVRMDLESRAWLEEAAKHLPRGRGRPSGRPADVVRALILKARIEEQQKWLHA